MTNREKVLPIMDNNALAGALYNTYGKQGCCGCPARGESLKNCRKCLEEWLGKETDDV